MATLSKIAIKKLVKKYAKANITDAAAEELAKAVEETAIRMSKKAMKKARKSNRNMITKKDISVYG